MATIDRIGKYRIDGVLGSGAMGVVYKAYDADIARTVALKTIRHELLDGLQEADIVARFRNEAQASGRLVHPNIVAVYDFGAYADTTYIAMEYVDGTPLNAFLVKDVPMDLAASITCITQLLRALDYAHARGVVHRDIKPANILITGDAQVKITDFGISRATDDGTASRFISDTMPAAVYCAIMSPESTPTSCARNGGSPWLRARSRKRSVRRSLIEATSAAAIARKSST